MLKLVPVILSCKSGGYGREDFSFRIVRLPRPLAWVVSRLVKPL